MGHLGFMREEYQHLQGRLMQGPVGLPVPEEPEAREAMYDILRILFSPEEARLASRMPFAPSTAAAIARLVDRPVAEVQGRLESMAERAVILDLVHPETGKAHYVLPPPIVGFFEFSMMRRREDIPQKRLAEAMEQYMGGDMAFPREVGGKTTGVGRTLVHETALAEELSTEILSYERASEIIRSASTGAISLCYCRHKAEHLGHACDTPQEICTSLNAGAEWAIRRGFARRASTSELLENLDQARERGLVQMGDNVQNRPTFICHCCACCCEALRAVNTYGLRGALMSSNYVATMDRAPCKGCGRCARACPAHAISMHASPALGAQKRPLFPRVDESVCLGCGVCVRRCRNEAITMAPRPVRVLTPESSIARVVNQAIERGRLAHILFETASRPTLLRRFLAAVLSLPPARKILALGKVKSLFIKQAGKNLGPLQV